MLRPWLSRLTMSCALETIWLKETLWRMRAWRSGWKGERGSRMASAGWFSRVTSCAKRKKLPSEMRRLMRRQRARAGFSSMLGW